MIEFGGTIYYIDVEALDKAITPVGIKPTDEVVLTETRISYDDKGNVIGSETNTSVSLRGKEIDGPKYDIFRMMIDLLIDNHDDDEDTSLGSERALEKKPLAYKVAFNTLYQYGILKEKE